MENSSKAKKKSSSNVWHGGFHQHDSAYRSRAHLFNSGEDAQRHEFSCSINLQRFGYENHAFSCQIAATSKHTTTPPPSPFLNENYLVREMYIWCSKKIREYLCLLHFFRFVRAWVHLVFQKTSSKKFS